MPPKAPTKTAAAKTETKYKLSYFNIRGRGELARLMFAQAGVKYEDVRIDGQTWGQMKKENPSGTLPVLEVEGKKFGQSMAIVRYLAQQFSLYGEEKLEGFEIDEFLSNIVDFLVKVYEPVFEQDKDKKAELTKKFAESTLPNFLKMAESKVARTGWVVGKKISAADLALYDVLFNLKQSEGDKFMSLTPKLKPHFEKVESQPNIKAWLAKRPKTDM